MTTPTLPTNGSCRCGQVSLAISAAPIITTACHCTGCQTMTASAFSLTASIPAAGFAVTGDEPVVGGLHGANKHMFCPRCLTWMFTRPEGLDFIVNVRATLLEVADWKTPFVEVFTSEKLPWAKTPAVHSYETVPAFADYESLAAEYAASTAT